MSSIETPPFVPLPIENDRSKAEDEIHAHLKPGDAIPEHSTLRTVVEATNVKVSMIQATNTDNRVVAAFNPTEFEQSVPTDWNRMVAPGGSFSRIHFLSTRNYTVDLELYWTAFTSLEADIADKARKQLLAWNYPEFNESGWSLGPSRIHFIWPGPEGQPVTDMTCYMIDLRVKNLRFARDGRVMRWTASMKLEEALDSYVLSGANGSPISAPPSLLTLRRR